MRTGTGSMGAKYTCRFADRGDDPDRRRVVLRIDSNKANGKLSLSHHRALLADLAFAPAAARP